MSIIDRPRIQTLKRALWVSITTVFLAAVFYGSSPLLPGVVGVETASAQEQPKTIDDLLRAVQQGRSRENADNRRREAEFRKKRNRQKALMQKAQSDVHIEERRSEELEATFNDNDKRVSELEELLAERMGAFGEMFGVVRQIAGSFRAQIENSVVSAQYPGRAKFLDRLAQTDSLPSSSELEAFWHTMQLEMTEQGKTARFDAPVVGLNGEAQTQEVIRVGAFTAISDGQFLKFERGQLSELPRQPAARFMAAADNLEDADGEIVRAAIDPSRGSILGLLVSTPNLLERVNQGGYVGYVILAIFALGVLLAGERIVTLSSTASSVRRQARRGAPSKSNPLGRVLLVYEENQRADVETLELKLDDAILRERPRLERGLNILQVFAAVAPLLGLLGTVTGMILTFQAITLFGTGDPKTMASGISQALVTTVLGLVTAIPLVILHSFASSRSRTVLQILEEQAAGLIAERAER